MGGSCGWPLSRTLALIRLHIWVETGPTITATGSLDLSLVLTLDLGHESKISFLLLESISQYTETVTKHDN